MFDIGIARSKGRRKDMEDYYCLEAFAGGLYIGVYDGHCYEDGRKNVPEILSKKMPGLYKAQFQSDPLIAFARSYAEIDAELAAQKNGAAVADVFMHEGIIYHANCGDVQIVVVDKDFGNLRVLSLLHRLANEQEKTRVVKHGAIIEKNFVCHPNSTRGLAITRTIGDQYLRSVGVNCIPHTGQYQIKEDDRYLLIATDGLFDFLDSTVIYSIVAKAPTAQSAAEQLQNTIFTTYAEEIARNVYRDMDNFLIVTVALT